MQQFDDASRIDAILASEGIKLFYLSRTGCGVCTAIKPKVEAMLCEFPRIEAYDIDLDEHPIVAGRFEVFTIPAVLLYAEGREFIREARYFSVEELAGRIRRYYELMYSPARREAVGSEAALVDPPVNEQ
jgi:thiol-disulfide isomerase/thioredoxin